MKKISFLVILVSVLGLLTGLESCQSTKSSTASKMLKFNFEKGKGYDYEMIMDMDQEMQGMKQAMMVTTYYAMDVTDDAGGIKTITTTFNAFRMKMDVMGLNIDVDSEKPMPADTSETRNPLVMMNKLFRAIKGQHFQMKVDPEGKVLEVTGMEEMASALVDSLSLGKENEAAMKQSFSQQFNEKGMKEQFERAFFIFPNKEVKVGDSWVKTSQAAPSTQAEFVTTYTVTEIEGDMVTLDLESKIKSDESGKSYKGKQEGTMVVDSRSGLIMNADLDIDLDIEVEGKPFKMKAKNRIRGKER